MKMSWLTGVLVIGLSGAFAAPARADESESEDGGRWARFGLTGRFTDRENHDGTNVSPLISWDPAFYRTKGLALNGGFGAGMLKGEDKNFFGLRYQVGVELRDLIPYVAPELIAGAETWIVDKGGTYPVVGVNLHIAETVFAGYHWVMDEDVRTTQVVVGVRIAFGGGSSHDEKPAETRPESPAEAPAPAEPTEEPAASEPAEPTEEPAASEPAAPAAETPTVSTPEPQPAAAETVAGSPIFRDGSSIWFDTARLGFRPGVSKLTPEGRAYLKQIAAVLKEHDKDWTSLAIVGHADASGPEPANVVLSRKRAQIVRQALIADGVPAAKLTAEGHGSTPLLPDFAPNANEQRRVELRFANPDVATQMQAAFEQMKGDQP